MFDWWMLIKCVLNCSKYLVSEFWSSQAKKPHHLLFKPSVCKVKPIKRGGGAKTVAFESG